MSRCSSTHRRPRPPGVVRDVVFRRISVTGPLTLPLTFYGADAEHDVAGITLDGMRVNGRRCASAADLELKIGPHVRVVRFAPLATEGA